MNTLSKRVAKLEVANTTGVDGIKRLVMVTGPMAMEPEQIMEAYGIPVEDGDFYIRLVGVAPEGGKPADSPCSIKIGRSWLVVDDKRTEAEI